MTCTNEVRSQRDATYTMYGLTVRSEIELPELMPAPAQAAEPDVEVRYAPVPADLEGGRTICAALQVSDRRCLIKIDGIANFLVEDGCQIQVELLRSPDSNALAHPRDMRLFLLGSAFGAVLHQRQWLPLHVSAVAAPSGVWAFAGPSGAGKSTLAAWLNKREGWAMVSDDVAVLRPDGDFRRVLPGPPRMKLWRNALSALGIPRDNLVRDLTRFDKFHINAEDKFDFSVKSLKTLSILDICPDDVPSSLERLTGTEAFNAIMSSIYRPELAELFQTPHGILQNCARLLSVIKVYRYRRHRSLAAFDVDLEPLVERMRHLQAC